MNRHPLAALIAIAAAGGLVTTLATAAPALADPHHGGADHRDGRGGWQQRAWHGNDRGGRDRDDHRDRDWNGGYVGYAAPSYGYVYPAYPAYPAYGYVQPSQGYLNVHTPGFSFGVGF